MPRNLITQCYKCQGFGHIAVNCFRKVCCEICAGEHNMQNCAPHSAEKCANCGASHRATDTICEAYIRAVSRKQSARGKTRETQNFNAQINNKSSPISSLNSSSSFASAVRSKQMHDRNVANNTSQAPKQQHENFASIGSLFAELKSFFYRL